MSQISNILQIGPKIQQFWGVLFICKIHHFRRWKHTARPSQEHRVGLFRTPWWVDGFIARGTSLQATHHQWLLVVSRADIPKCVCKFAWVWKPTATQKKRSWMACKRFIKRCRNRFMEWIKPQRWLRRIPFKHSIGNEKNPHMTSGIFRSPLLQLQRWTLTSLSHQNSRSTLETLLTKCYITCESSAKTFRLLIIQLRREMLGRVLVHILDMHPAFQDALATPQALHTPIQRLRSPTPTKNSPKRAWQIWYIFKYFSRTKVYKFWGVAFYQGIWHLTSPFYWRPHFHWHLTSPFYWRPHFHPELNYNTIYLVRGGNAAANRTVTKHGVGF